VATSEQIAAAAHTAKPSGGDGFVDRKAQHILGGAYHPSPAEERSAARLLARAAPDLAARLLLPTVTRDAASPLLGLVARGDLTGARAWIGDRDAAGISAVRAALAHRRKDREADRGSN
jgi:hypothetical protein